MSSAEHGQTAGQPEEQPVERAVERAVDGTTGTGRLLAGRYRVVDRLGRGGMGVVWRAVDEVLGREVAVKELRTFTDAGAPELAALRLRMQREARAAARIRHRGVVAVHDVTEIDGRPLIVMELVDGHSLDDVLSERGTLDPRETAGIGSQDPGLARPPARTGGRVLAGRLGETEGLTYGHVRPRLRPSAAVPPTPG